MSIFGVILLAILMLASVRNACSFCDRYMNKVESREGYHCETECDKPYVCVNDTGPSAYPDSTSAKYAPPFCRCLPPYKNADGACYRDTECAEDEFYEDYVCKKRCALDEYRSNGTCLKVSQLGQSCIEREQCKSTFTECINGTCQCQSGFAQIDENTCKSQNFECPIGDPLRHSDSIFECSYEPNFRGGKPHQIECPTGYLCVHNDLRSSSRPGKKDAARGHCCPTVTLKCPQGEALTNVTCVEYDYLSDVKSTCPEDTHECILIDAPWGPMSERLCCPKPCSKDQVFANGECRTKRRYGDRCSFDNECYGIDFVCDNGRCACAPGFLASVRDYTLKYQGNREVWCEKRCTDDEHSGILGGCIKSKKLGETCDHTQVGSNSGCRGGSSCMKETGTCECACDQFPVDDYTCTKKPECPNVDTWKQTNFTFCRIKETTGKNERIVDKCSAGFYCTKHWDYRNSYSIGVCCPMLEPLCPGQTNGTAIPCDPQKPNACGAKSWCWRYLRDEAIDSDPMKTHICC